MNDEHQLESALAALFFRATCPDGLQLGEFQTELLPAHESETILAHLANCPYCGRDLALTQRFMRAAQPAERPTKSGVAWRVRVAQLLDSLRAPQPALQLRGSAPEPAIYLVDDVQIALTVERLTEGVALVGFVAGVAAISADFWQNDQLVASVPIDESGSFAVEQIAVGRYQLLLRAVDSAIEIPELVLAS